MVVAPYGQMAVPVSGGVEAQRGKGLLFRGCAPSQRHGLIVSLAEPLVESTCARVEDGGMCLPDHLVHSLDVGHGGVAPARCLLAGLFGCGPVGLAPVLRLAGPGDPESTPPDLRYPIISDALLRLDKNNRQQ